MGSKEGVKMEFKVINLLGLFVNLTKKIIFSKIVLK
jgi:hypothetical protein